MRRRRRLAVSQPTSLAIALLAALVVLVVPPTLMLLSGALRSGPPGEPYSFSTAPITGTLGDARTWDIIRSSVVIATFTTVFAAVLGTGLAWLTTRTDLPLRRFLGIGIIAPFFVPGAITASAWARLANPSNGLLNEAFDGVGLRLNVYSMTGIVGVEVMYGLPLIYLAAAAAFSNMDSGLEEAAMANGASRLRAALGVSTPLVALSITGMSALLFLRMLATFEVPYLLGTPAGIEVFSSAIYREIYQRSPPGYNTASALSLIVTVTAVALLALVHRLGRRRTFETVRGKGFHSQVLGLGRYRWPALAGVGLYVLIAAVLPLAGTVAAALSASGRMNDLGGWTLSNFFDVLRIPRVAESVWDTLQLALIVGVLATLITTVCVYVASRSGQWLGRPIAFLLDLPLVIPGAVLGLALLWVWLPITSPIDLYGTTTLLVIGYLLVGLPVASRVLSGGVVQLHPELEESAWVHGVSRPRSFVMVAVPLLVPAIRAGFFFAAVVVLKDAATAAMLSTTDTATLPVIILDYSRSGDSAAVSVLSTVLLGIVGLLLVTQAILAAALRRFR